MKFTVKFYTRSGRIVREVEAPTTFDAIAQAWKPFEAAGLSYHAVVAGTVMADEEPPLLLPTYADGSPA